MKQTFHLPPAPGFESITRFENSELDVTAFIVRNDSTLGIPLGGCRVWESYESESEALVDCLRLAHGMTHKSAIHNLPLGGGKMVVFCRRPLVEIDRVSLFKFVGWAVAQLEGAYITAEDFNSTVEDMEVVRSVTPHVAGIDSGDPSEMTALGVWEVIKYLATHHLKKSIEDCSIAVQGVGKVGEILVRTAVKDGLTNISICDIDVEKSHRLLRELKINSIIPELIYDVVTDIFVPCACGGVLNQDTIPRLHCSAVAGAANNVLESPLRDELLLKEKSILYCPDVVVNGGGVINVSCEFPKYSRSRALSLVHNIPLTLQGVLEFAAEHDMTATEAVFSVNEKRLRNAPLSAA